MKAFIEWLTAGVGIVRAGPRAATYGDPFEYAVVFKLHRKYDTFGDLDHIDAEIKGLVARRVPWWMFWVRPFGHAHRRAVYGLLREQGYRPYFERFK